MFFPEGRLTRRVGDISYTAVCVRFLHRRLSIAVPSVAKHALLFVLAWDFSFLALPQSRPPPPPSPRLCCIRRTQHPEQNNKAAWSIVFAQELLVVSAILLCVIALSLFIAVVSLSKIQYEEDITVLTLPYWGVYFPIGLHGGWTLAGKCKCMTRVLALWRLMFPPSPIRACS